MPGGARFGALMLVVLMLVVLIQVILILAVLMPVVVAVGLVRRRRMQRRVRGRHGGRPCWQQR